MLAEMLRWLPFPPRSGRKYARVENLVLDFGRPFIPQGKPKDIRWGKRGDCFRNALFLAGGKFIYCEGFATTTGMTDLPVHHAWVCDRGGNVIDNTWREQGAEYFGVPFQFAFVMEILKSRGGVAGLLYGNGTQVWLVDGFPREAIWTDLESSIAPRGD